VNIGYISLGLRCVIVTTYWNLSTVYNYVSIYSNLRYIIIYMHLQTTDVSVKLPRIADIRHTFLYALSCTKFIRNCTLLNVPDCDCNCGYMIYQFLLRFDKCCQFSTYNLSAVYDCVFIRIRICVYRILTHIHNCAFPE